MARANIRITKEQKEAILGTYNGNLQDLLDDRLKDFNARCRLEGIESQLPMIFKHRLKRKKADVKDDSLDKGVIVTIRTDDESYKEFKGYCDSINFTVSEIMRSLLAEYIEEYKDIRETREKAKVAILEFAELSNYEEIKNIMIEENYDYYVNLKPTDKDKYVKQLVPYRFIALRECEKYQNGEVNEKITLNFERYNELMNWADKYEKLYDYVLKENEYFMNL